jgi:hypothetical protein
MQFSNRNPESAPTSPTPADARAKTPRWHGATITEDTGQDIAAAVHSEAQLIAANKAAAASSGCTEEELAMGLESAWLECLLLQRSIKEGVR